MAGQSPNSVNIGRVASGVSQNTSIVVHPEYVYWRSDWAKLRDAVAGQRAVKEKEETYLRKLKNQDREDYLDYIAGAVYHNMTGQTLNGMVGQVFLRDPVIQEFPKKFSNAVRSGFGKDGSGHTAFSKTVISEILTTGRYGVLVDAPAASTTVPTSFAVGYSAENILDWKVEPINGTFQVTRVLLREFIRKVYSGPSPQNPWIGMQSPGGRVPPHVIPNANSYVQAYAYETVYRELLLQEQEDGSYVYVQNTYLMNINTVAATTVTPTVRGRTLDFIPFMFFGSSYNTSDCEKPPLLDIADLNISHYKTYAELEWGRKFTALPVYYAPGRDDTGAAEYNIGPSVVWEVPDGSIPGILEYKGEGLKQLESGLDCKEKQIASIGGRLMSGGAKGSESPEETASRENNEIALILNAIQSTEFGMTQVLRWWLMWRDIGLDKTDNLNYSMNRAFGKNAVDARLLRVLQQLHDEGKLPVEVLLNAVIQTGFIDPETTLEEFTIMLADPENFPNNPDVAARLRGFTSRQQELDQVQFAREADMQDHELELQEREVVLMENAPPPLPPKPPGPQTAAVPARPSGPTMKKPGRAPKTKSSK